MTKIQWAAVGDRRYEAGVDRGVFYPQSGPGLAWNGLLNISEKETSPDAQAVYSDGLKYQRSSYADEFSATVQAFTYPDEFDDYNGVLGEYTAQNRRLFAFSYRTLVGDDVTGLTRGYRIHLVYNALVAPSDIDRKSMTNVADPDTFSWDVSTLPVTIEGARASAHLVIDSTIANAEALEAIENALYGTALTAPYIPSPDEVVQIFMDHAELKIVLYPDGTWTATGPEHIVSYINPTTFKITSPSAVYLDEDTYQVSTW
jgi:hypothetical protein